jgi:hypothetical protein
MEQIWTQIRRAKVLLAELTGKNPNVFYELGLAHACRKPVVFISGNIDDVPFDVRSFSETVWADYLAEIRATQGAGALEEFMAERELHLFERRGFKADEGRAVTAYWREPASAFKRVEALAQARKAKGFESLAVLFKRVKNITKEFSGELTADARARLVEPAEAALLSELDARLPAIDAAVAQAKYADAMRELAALSAPVDRFFVDVLVMAEDPAVRSARLAFDGTKNLSYDGLYQSVLVSPSTRYRFQGFLRTDQISTESGIRFEILDPKDQKNLDITTQNETGTAQWTLEQAEFTTGSQTRLILIRIARKPSVRLDNKLRGTVWIDDISLVSLAGK